MKLQHPIFLFLFLLTGMLHAQECEEFEIAGENCQTAPLICNLEGYCSNNFTAVGDPTPDAFCGFVENDVWLAFTAGTQLLELEIEPFNCQELDGIQAAILETSNCSNFTLVSNCFNSGSQETFILTAPNLTVGQTYYIIIDGKGGDNCEFTFNLLQGTTITPDWAEVDPEVLGCEGVDNTLQGISNNNSSTVSFEWTTLDGNITGGENTLTPTVNAPGTYTFIVNDVAQICADTVTTVFDFHDPILLNIPTPGILNCLDNVTVDLEVEISGVDDPYVFSWTDAQGDEVSTEQTATIDVPGDYSVLVTNQITTCSEVAQTEVIADTDTPIAVIQDPVELDCITDTITINASGSSENPDFIVSWFSPDGSIISDPSQLEVEVNSVGNYQLNILNPDNGCEADAEVEVTRNPAEPVGIFSSVRNPCFDETTGTITLDSVDNGNPGFLFSFDSSAYTNITFFENLEPGDYALSVLDEVGCTYDTVVSIVPQDEILVDLGPDFEIFLGDSTNLSPEVSEDSLTYSWFDTNPYLSCYDCPEPIVSPLISGVYLLQVESANGCIAFDTLTVYVNEEARVFVPTVFSPNEDGINDLLYVNTGNEVAKIINFRIYDRWGSLLFEENDFLPNDPNMGFDGRHRGRVLNTSVLIWQVQVELTDGRREWFQGTTLVLP